MNSITFRQASKADMEWAYETFRTTMKSYIEDTWGWDELFQQYGFAENLRPASFTIAALNSVTVGTYSLTEKADHLWLEMLLILPDYQNQGLGTRIVQTIQTEASLKQKSLRLSVLKVNPAREFYRRLGFEISSEDTWSYKLSWSDSGGNHLLS